jgi:hypothetical protein
LIEVRFCGYCGKQLRDQARFCPYCGKAIQQTQVLPPNPKAIVAANKGQTGSHLPPASSRKLSKPKKIVCILTIVVIIIASFSFLYSQALTNPAGSLNSIFPTPVLQISVHEQTGVWQRSAITDLPEYTENIIVSVKNTGNGEAKHVQVTVKDSVITLAQYSIASLLPSQSNDYPIKVTLDYDSSKDVSVEVACSQSSDQSSIHINAFLPRLLYPTVSELYITPDQQDVTNLKNQIISNKLFLTPDWVALRDWVGSNIQYKYDSAVHGKDEYWQLPKETINLGTGDCEDFSILLCSLLRADGWSSDNAFVVVGENGGSYHAWVRIIWNGVEYNLEPQFNGLGTLFGDFESLSGYTMKNKFNDVRFETA